MIIVKNGVLYILIEFESDRISTKNGRKGAHGLNCKIFVNFEAIFEIYDENYSRKSISCLSDDFEFFAS